MPLEEASGFKISQLFATSASPHSLFQGVGVNCCEDAASFEWRTMP